jgi:putative nucleotidyltransferase with HDIG domain
MPEMEGIELIRELKRINSDCVIIVLLEENDPHLIGDLSKIGVYDFLVKPVNPEKLFFLIKKGADLHYLNVMHRKFIQSLQENNLYLHKQNSLLAKRIEESTKNLTRLYEDLRHTYMRTIKVLAQAIDAKDHYTHSHSQNVARFAVEIAKDMRISSDEIELIREACELHDLGKIGVDDNILTKSSGLTPEEWEQIKRHPQTAAQILEPLTFLNDVTAMIRQHHEHYDGTGYPEGLKGEQIILGARILHLADAYDSMTSPRSYRKVPFSKEEAVAEVRKHSGTQFDPLVVASFLRVLDRL